MHWIYFHLAFQQGELIFLFIYFSPLIFKYYVCIIWRRSLLEVANSSFIKLAISITVGSHTSCWTLPSESLLLLFSLMSLNASSPLLTPPFCHSSFVATYFHPNPAPPPFLPYKLTSLPPKAVGFYLEAPLFFWAHFFGGQFLDLLYLWTICLL